MRVGGLCGLRLRVGRVDEGGGGRYEGGEWNARAGAKDRTGASPVPTLHESDNQLPSYSRGIPLRVPSGLGGDASRLHHDPLRCPRRWVGTPPLRMKRGPTYPT